MQHLGWQSSCIIGETGKMVNKRQNLSSIYSETLLIRINSVGLYSV